MNKEQYFSAVYEETYWDILKFIIIKTGNADAVADIVQNVYHHFYRRIRRRGFRDIMAPKAFLITLAKKELTKHYARRKGDEEHFALDAAAEEAAVNIPFEKMIEDKALTERIWSLVKGEPLLSYQAFVLFYGYDKPIAEVAQTLHISEQATKNRLYRTRNRVRALMKGETRDE